MPFHTHLPHAHTVLPIVLSSALAFAAGAYYVARRGVPTAVRAFGARLTARVQARDAGPAARFTDTHAFSRGTQSRNSAFDAYRAETLKRLEDEADQFRDYLNGLRTARDKAEFDAFLDARRTGKSDH